jgi:signal transduction histidine kinase
MPQVPFQSYSEVTEETQRRGELVLRTLPILLIPVFSALATLLLVSLTMRNPIPDIAGAPSTRPPGVIGIIVIAVFFTALIILVRLGRPTVSALLLIGVWTLITTMATLQGGVASLGPALLVIPICAAGLLIDGVASLSLAALATVLVVSLAWMERLGLYTVSAPQLPIVASSNPLMALPLITATVWVGLFWTVALLTWLLAGGLQRALTQSREQAQALHELSRTLEARVAAQTTELALRATRAEALYEVSQAVTSTLDLNPVLGLITEQAARLLNFDSAQVLLQQEDGSLASLSAYGSPGGVRGEMTSLAPISQEHWQRGEPRVVPWPMTDQHPGKTDRMALMLPMRYGTTVSGVLVLTNADGRADCGPDDLILGQGLADQAAVAIANAQLLARTRETAMLEERTRLARDIHDTLAQGLTGIVVQLGAAQRALAVAPDESREHLALAQRMARESLAEARRSVWNLRAPALDRGDLVDALRSVAVRPLGSDVAVTFELTGEPWPLTTAIESTLLRVAQEALANVARHSQATEARLALVYRADSVELSVGDNGVGFDSQAAAEDGITPGPWGGFGLIGMRERVAALGGSLAVTSHDGVQVTATIPRPGSAAPTAQAVTKKREGAV